ncbi:hypothetical protein ACOI1C_05885 [Bacillus sp. DJP31]|uniref:hypothetical protein n=1 Tax=Bacillus sp. DJP31 TaxID=3409789 RepID=UPI003BB782D8
MRFSGKYMSLLVASLIFVSGCSNTTELESMKAERDQLKARVVALSEENQQLRQEVSLVTKVVEPLSFNYLEPLEKRRFVLKELPLLILPQVDSQSLNTISPNTVVEIQDFVEVNGEVWLHVTIPVFDSPTNMKGWIKEEDSELYTLEKQEFVKSPVMVKEGTNVYKVDLVTELSTVEAEKNEANQTCFISDEQDEYLALGCAGGTSFIVKKSDVVYPTLE